MMSGTASALWRCGPRKEVFSQLLMPIAQTHNSTTPEIATERVLPRNLKLASPEMRDLRATWQKIVLQHLCGGSCTITLHC